MHSGFGSYIQKTFLATTLLVASVILFVLPSVAEAATLSVTPQTASRTVGETFTVSVVVGTEGTAINAVSGTLSFPTDILQVTSVSKTGSILDLWVQDPSYSNTQGTVSFEGIAFNPGYTGTRGTIVVVTFRAKSTGVAEVRFSSGSVLANDGEGTEVLATMGPGSFTIRAQEQATAPEPATPTETTPVSIVNTAGDAPQISSPTHPDQAAWYASNTPRFVWVLPPGAEEVRTLIGSSAKGTPSIRYTPPIKEKQVDPLPDGTYYFSLQMKTADGWSGVSRYRVNIDATPPQQFSITFPQGNESLLPRLPIRFVAVDRQSSVARYEVKIDANNSELVPSLANGDSYLMPAQYPGTHVVTVTAFDEAGNQRSATENFTILGIEAPRITESPEEVEIGDSITVRGTTYPDSTVTLYIKNKGGIVLEESAESNSNGDWVVMSTARLDAGAYQLTARVKDARGAQSNESTAVQMVAVERRLLLLTDTVLRYLSAALLVILALAILAAAIGFAWYRTNRFLRHLRRESHEAQTTLQKSFKLLRSDIRKHITQLKAVQAQRKLTAEEIAFLQQFDQELAEAEDIIEKEIQDISDV